VVAVIKSHKLGIIAENSADIHTLRKVATEAGMEISSTVEFSRWSSDQTLKEDIDAWVVNLDVEALEKTCPEKIDALIDAIPGLMILCEGGSPPTPVAEEYANWSRRLLLKLHDISGSLNLANHENSTPERVWVLVGSIGGPDAIHRFLEMLPPGLDIAFIYANHLQADFDQVLADAVEKNTHYPAYVLRHGDILATNKVAVVSPEFVTTIKANGTAQVSQQRWQGQYHPSLDHIVSSVAGTFGHTGGVIVFSGMCDDGAASCRIMKQNGGKVWVQRPDTCVSSAMPDAAIATGCVEKTGTPDELASDLVRWVNELSKSKNKR